MKESVNSFVMDSGYFEEREVRKFINDKKADATCIWALFVLSLWWRQYAAPVNGGV